MKGNTSRPMSEWHVVLHKPGCPGFSLLDQWTQCQPGSAHCSCKPSQMPMTAKLHMDIDFSAWDMQKRSLFQVTCCIASSEHLSKKKTAYINCVE